MKRRIISIALISFAALCFFSTVHADTTIHLDIEASSGSLYNQDITVAPCDSDNAGTMAITAYCAVKQAGLSAGFANDWSWFGTDAFLNSLGGLANDFISNIYWGWFGDLTYGATSLSAHTLTPGEHILLNYNINPLKIEVSNLNPVQHDTVTITLTQFGLDSSFNPVWAPATGGSVTVNGTSYPVASDGTYALILDLAAPYTITGSKTSFVDSNTITLNPSVLLSASGPLAVPGTAISSSTAATVIISTPVIKPTFDTSKAMNFLVSKQEADGSYGEDIYTDWSGLALATSDAYAVNKNAFQKYISEHAIKGTLLTDYERRAMTLMAFGLNPYSTNDMNYINKIVGSFDGKQFGDTNEDNDDIFALIVLANAGYGTEEKIISDGLPFVLSRQRTNGSWDESIDMTGAALEALAPFATRIEVASALVKGKGFLKDNQEEDGGFGNVSSTAWAIEGILALSEKPEMWTKNGKSPLDYLAEKQASDGGIKNDNPKNKIWETAYTITALSFRPWKDIMQKFEKQELIRIENPAVSERLVAKEEPKKKLAKTTDYPASGIVAEAKVKKEEHIATENTASAITAFNTITDNGVKEPQQKSKPGIIRRFFNFIFGIFY